MNKFSKNTLLLFVLSLSIFVGCSKEAKNPKNELSDNVSALDEEQEESAANYQYEKYQFDDFSLSLVVPKNWYVLNEEERKEFKKIEDDNINNIFVVFKDNINNRDTVEFNQNLYIIVENIKNNKDKFSLDKYIEKYISDMKKTKVANSLSFSNTEDVKIGDNKAKKFIASVSYPNLDIKEEYYFVLYDNHLYTIVSTYAEDTQPTDLNNIIDSIKIGKTA